MSPHPRYTPVGERDVVRGVRNIFRGLDRTNATTELLAGVTLVAIAIPEQLATSQLAGVPAISAMMAFVVATLVMTVAGSNPVLSVGADSTIAPMFAVALVALAPLGSSHYLSAVALTAVVTGTLVLTVGLLRGGWTANFLSRPIVTGFLAGIGLLIVIHQLPNALGVPGSAGSTLHRLVTVADEFRGVRAWPVALALGTLGLLVVGERRTRRIPWALVAIVVSTVLVHVASLTAHGVNVVGHVTLRGPQWRLASVSGHELSLVVTTSLLLSVIILSQSAVTSRSSADEIAVAVDFDRDLRAIGGANLLCGLCGLFPVNASPARTTLVADAGGRTKFSGAVAVAVALVVAPFAGLIGDLPLASLAGVLFFIAVRLLKVGEFAHVWRVSRVEFSLAVVAALGVILFDVEIGLGVAVALAILDQTARAARPHAVELGRRKGTTSWEPLDEHHVRRVDHVMVVLFDQDLFFANATVFRNDLHRMLRAHPKTHGVIIDAVAMSDVDYTGLVMLEEVVRDLTRDGIAVAFARTSERVRERIAHESNLMSRIEFAASVDEAVEHLMKK